MDPISSQAVAEVAKAGGKVIDGARELGAFVGRVLGTVPEDAVAVLGGAWLHEVRIRIGARLAARTEEILAARGVKNTVPVSPSLAIPLLTAAQDEGRLELQELWARLLANAMDPARANDIRLEFIETVKRFHPLDAVIMQMFSDTPSGQFPENARNHLIKALKLEIDQVEVSLAALERAGCIGKSHSPLGWLLLPFGRELMKACSS